MLAQYNVMVTAGANQAFINVLLTLTDASDEVILFKPYYFNHLMALQMTGGAANVVYGPCDTSTWHPDLDWLEQELSGPSPPKMVVLVTPNNPTGAHVTVTATATGNHTLVPIKFLHIHVVLFTLDG